MPGEALDRAVPLATTRAITSYMKSLTASKEHLVYRSCEALLEATASDKNNVLAYYDRLQENYGFAPEFIGALKEHIDVDQDFGHDEIFDELLSEYTSVPSDLVGEILQSCRTLADLFVLWNREVATYYGRLDKPAVRTEHETLAVPASARAHHPALWIEWSAHHGRRAVFAGRSAKVTPTQTMAATPSIKSPSLRAERNRIARANAARARVLSATVTLKAMDFAPVETSRSKVALRMPTCP